jgi:glycosyltransferase involved in cell wall biosynthesis
LVIARLRGAGVIVNYRGGHADEFLARAPSHVRWTLQQATLRVVPSAYLHRVFAKYGMDSEVIPNIIDLSRFQPAQRPVDASPHLIVTRNLEPIYDVATALRAFAVVRERYPSARLTVAGSGPELAALERLAAELDIANAVAFPGRIDNAQIPALYASADCMLNPSTVDNMPISILEALACGVPVVSTRAGGVPDLVEDGVTALLVAVGDHAAMAASVLRVLGDRSCAEAVRAAGLAEVKRYSWPRVKQQWQGAYQRASRRASPLTQRTL